MKHSIHSGIGVLRSLVNTLRVSKSKDELIAFAKCDSTLSDKIGDLVGEDAYIALENFLGFLDEKLIKVIIDDISGVIPQIKKYIDDFNKSDKGSLELWQFEIKYWDSKKDSNDEFYIASYNWHKAAGDDDADGEKLFKFLDGILDITMKELLKKGWKRYKDASEHDLFKMFGPITVFVDLYTGDNDGNLIAVELSELPYKVYDKAKWHYPSKDGADTIEAACVHILAVMNWMKKHAMLSDEGIRELREGASETLVLSTHEVTLQGAYMLNYLYGDWLKTVKYGEEPSMRAFDDYLKKYKRYL